MANNRTRKIYRILRTCGFPFAVAQHCAKVLHKDYILSNPTVKDVMTMFLAASQDFTSPIYKKDYIKYIKTSMKPRYSDYFEDYVHDVTVTLPDGTTVSITI